MHYQVFAAHTKCITDYCLFVICNRFLS